MLHRFLNLQGLSILVGSKSLFIWQCLLSSTLQWKMEKCVLFRFLPHTLNPQRPRNRSNLTTLTILLVTSATCSSPPFFNTRYASHRYSWKFRPIKDRQNTAMSTELPLKCALTSLMSHAVTCSLSATRSNDHTLTRSLS